jgi:hypothetical protein
MKKVILSMALLTTGFTCSYAASVADMTKDALINKTDFKVAGTFGAYDFAPKGDKNKFDWAFTTSGGDIYQLRGGEASENDVFGWAKAPAGTVAPAPAWYMFQVDVDGDGMGKFDWVLLSANGNAVYKLDGVADDGGFAYAGPIDIDYKVNGNSITTGAKGTLDETAEPQPQPVDDDPNKLHVTNASDLYGYTIKSIKTKVGAFDAAQMTYTIECSGNFTTTLNTELGSMTMTGNSIDVNRGREDKTILFLGTDNDDQEAREWIYYKNDNNDIIINQSISANAEGWYIESITQNSACD